MDYIVHGILQARILEWVAYPFSSGSSPPRNQTRVSWIAGGSFTSWATREAQMANETTLNILTPGFPGGASGKESDCQWRRCRRYDFDSQVRKIPWRWKWYPTHISLPGNFYGQRSLVGHSPWGHKESNATEHKNTPAEVILFFILLYLNSCLCMNSLCSVPCSNTAMVSWLP